MKQYFSFQWHITDECDQRCKYGIHRLHKQMLGKCTNASGEDLDGKDAQ